ncbi:family 43 glycosylhydrolase [Desertivirga arenae]|uniref:family 43 glycosylhydrolase n=1 Tax=Desertivirga arenae TaxID=2810309 RepID=UPI001A975944|nr:family 43 glycosylhydrolase [Pedobacter sp. SYSU D00823]
MKTRKKRLQLLLIILSAAFAGKAQQPSTYCNPLNLDYTYMIYNAYDNISYRSGADPAVVKFKGEYYMFVTRSLGYWHSTDLTNWKFITPEKWYFQGSNAPAAHNYKDSVLYVAGDPSGSMSVLFTDNPKKGDWKAIPGILNDLQDPDLFIDDDGKTYMFWGSSNLYPIRAKILDRSNNFKPSGKPIELFNLNELKHGWERFGENHSDTLEGYIEGPWMTKHNNKYYLQYAAPGTEFNVYGDGAYIGDSPLGPFKYMPNNPFSYKPGGFMNGAGHGSTVIGPGKQYWHFASMAVSINVNWERRLCMFPTYFDTDGLMYSNTSFGDYPHYGPAEGEKAGRFTGWMLLSYKKPVKASSQLDDFDPSLVADESVKTFWVANKNDNQQWLEMDLQKPCKVYAIQVNYHDYKSNLYGRLPGLSHQFLIEGSLDGLQWITLVDRSSDKRDTPNDYEQLAQPQKVRFVRYKNIHVPTPHLSISGLRVFGNAGGKLPAAVQGFEVIRKTDRRDALLKWKKLPGVQGYNVLWGIAPDKLYSSWMVYDNDSLELKSLSADQEYYFSIEAFNENGVSARTKSIRIK